MKMTITLFILYLFCAGFASAQNLNLIFNQPYNDSTSAANSAFDTAEGIDFEAADNFFGLEAEIEEFVFYGLAWKIDNGWQEMEPADTEPFLIRFYEYEEGETTGLIAPVTGDYQVALKDSWGDGWGGHWEDAIFHTLSVFVNGVVVLDEITLPDGAGPVYHTFAADEGDEISTVFTINGAFANECFYAILDPDNNIIAEDGGSWDSPGVSTPQGIAPSGIVVAFEPDWANPLHEFNLDAAVTHVGSIWGGQRQLYKFVVAFENPVNLEAGWISAQIDSDNGSGAWFLWLNSLIGDGLAWHRIDATKTSCNRDMVHMSGISEKGELRFSNYPIAHDLAFELWGGELAHPPMCVTNLNPLDEAEGVNITGDLTWSGNPAAEGYNLFFGQLGSGWDIENGTDLGNVTSYAFSDLDYDAGYEWRVVPYNDFGAAEDCPAWMFTTISEPPTGSTCENPYIATLPIVDYMDNTEAYGNNYSSTWVDPSTSYLDGNDFVLQFTLHQPGFLTGSVDGSWTALIILMECPNPDVPAERLAQASGSNGGSFTDVFFKAGTYFAIVSKWPDPQFTDFTLNLSFEAAGDSPEFEISDDEWDFGSLAVGQQSFPKMFTITNTGLGDLVLQAPTLTMDNDFILNYDEDDFPATLAVNETVSFNVVFTPTSGGPKTGTVNINYNDGSSQSATIDLTGEGFLSLPGSFCENPYMATLPIIDYMDNTEAYGNNYSSTWVDPSTSYLDGNDFVLQFTLNQPGFLTGSVDGSWTGLIIVKDCPNPDIPAERLALVSGYDGGSFTDLLFEAGSYFAIVSTWPDPQFTDFTLNLSFELPPACTAPTSLTATSITNNSAVLGWTPIGAEAEWNIEWGETNFEQGTGTMITGATNNPYELSGLDAGTVYAFYVQAVCNGEESNWTGPGYFTTEFLAPVPYFEGFATTSPPAGWTTTGWIIGAHANIPSIDGNYIRRNLYGTGANQTGVFTTLNIGPVAADMIVSFNYILVDFYSPEDPPQAESGNFIVAVSTDYGETYEEVETIENNGVAGWQNYSASLNQYVGEFVKIKITGNRISGDYWLAFDNFSFGGGSFDADEPPLCASNPIPTNNAVNVSRKGSLNWTGYFTADGYKLYLGTSDRAWDIVDGADLGNELSYVYEGLDHLTTYNWKVVPYNDAGNAEDCPIWTFTTGEYILIDDFPWLEGFEDDFPPLGWSNTSWEQSSWGSPNTGEEWAYCNLAGSELITPEIQIPSTRELYELSFWYRAEGAFSPQNMDVLLSTDGEIFDVVVTEIVGATNIAYEEIVYPLEAYAGQSIWVKFIGKTGAGGWASFGILLDDVGVVISDVEPPVFYEVTFIVQNEEGDPINNATITLGEVTNPAGNYVFEVEADTYDYHVTANDYFDVEGSIIVIDDDVTETVIMTLDIEYYTVLFNVVGTNGSLTAAIDGLQIASGDEVEEGSNVLFTATPDEGYQMLQWTLNGDVLGDHDANTLAVEELSENIIVTVEFEEVEEEEPVADLHIAIEEDVIVVDEECFFATATIAVAGGDFVFTVKDGAAVTMAAGQKIRFLPGSSVESGGYLHAYISEEDPCGRPFARFEPAAPKDDVTDIEVIDETDGSLFFKMYPNPTTDEINIELGRFDDGQMIRIEIISQLGSQVIAKDMPAQQLYTISLGDQQPGFYIVRIIQGDRVAVERLIKR